MQGKHLSSSFSANSLKHISSYREQRMRSKPRINQSTDIIDPLASNNTARKDLEQIQECLKNNITRRRSSQGCISSVVLKSEPQSISRFRRENQPLDSPVVSDYLAAELENGRTRYLQSKYDSSLNVIEEKPINYTISRREGAGLKARIQLNSSKHLMPSTAINKPRAEAATPQDSASKQQPASSKPSHAKRQSKGNNLANSKFEKKEDTLHHNARGGSRPEAGRLLKRLQQFRQEMERVSLRHHHQIGVYLDKVADCLRDE